MIYLKEFNSQAEYEAAKYDLITPNVSFDSVSLHYISKPIVRQPSNEIWYTTVDGKAIELSGKTAQWKSETGYESNVYSNGKGVITFTNDLKTLGEECFRDFKTIDTISLPDHIQYIESMAFKDCEKLESVTINTKQEYLDEDVEFGIGMFAFEGCSNLKDINLSDSNGNGITAYIENYAFNGCSSIDTLYLPVTFYDVSDNSFDGLSHVVIYVNDPAKTFEGTYGAGTLDIINI